MADVNQVSVTLTNPKTNENYNANLRTTEDSVFLADGTSLKNLRENLWNTLAAQANLLLIHANTPHLTAADLANLVSAVAYNENTGELSVTKQDGTSAVVASGLNQSVKSFDKQVAAAGDADIPEGHTYLKLELLNGNIYKVDLTDFVNSNVLVNGTSMTAAYVTDDAATDTSISEYAAKVTLAATDEDSTVSTLIAAGKDGDAVKGDINITMTGLADASTATAKLYWKDATASGDYTAVDMLSDANTTPAFSCAFPTTTAAYVELYMVISDVVVSGGSAVPVYRTDAAIIHPVAASVEP